MALLEAYLGASIAEWRIERFSRGGQFLDANPSTFDIVLMDIDMPGIDGMETARELRAQGCDAALIFITNVARLAIAGYEVEALDFLVKPVGKEAFARAMDRAVRHVGSKARGKRSFAVKSQGDVRRIVVEEVYYVESSGSHVIIHTFSGPVRTRMTMKVISGLLDSQGFSRCNNAYLVNLAHVKGITRDEVNVGPDTLKISRAKKKAFMEDFARYVGQGV